MFCEGSGNIEYGSNGVNDVDHIREGGKKAVQRAGSWVHPKKLG